MSSSVSCLFTNHRHKSLLFRGMALTVWTVLNEGILKLVDVRCFVGEWLVHVLAILRIFMAWQPLVGQSLLIIEASRLHSGTLHSVGLLWTSDQPDVETSTWQHTTLTKNIHGSSGIRTRHPSKRMAADSCLRPRGHWNGRIFSSTLTF